MSNYEQRHTYVCYWKGVIHKVSKKSGLAHLFYANLISDKVILPQKRTLGTGNEKIKLLVVGRLTPQKGLEYLVGAIEELVNKKGYNLICDVVGKGGEETGLKDLITQRNLHEYFRFLDHIPWGEGLFNVYQRSDLFILPSLTEGFPKTIFEAMAFGVPVIATDVGGINGIIKHKYNGILVKARSTSGLTAAIHEICSQESMYSKIAENGYKTVRQFTVEVQQHKMLNIIMTHFNIPKKQLAKYER
jgi:glycosyltransferase involved in cell wall biosynthesis